MTDRLSSPIPHRPRILFVDDDVDVQKAAALLLPRHGFALLSARTPAEAWSVLAAEPVDVVLLDLNFQRGAGSGSEGLRCLEALLADDPQRVLVVVTGHSGVAIAVAAMRAGAADFVMKPWSNERLVTTLKDAVALRRRRTSRVDRIDVPEAETAADAPVIGESPAMRRVLEPMRQAAPSDLPILLLGEAGTGKSLLARTIHRLSSRAARPLRTLDPSASHAEGEAAWSSAWAAVDPQATLLLEEIAGLTPPLQARLLTCLETRPSLRLLATSRQPRDALQAGMRAELLYRLNTLELPLPPLRDRGQDVTLLAMHFLHLFGRRHRRPDLSFSTETTALIAAGRWQGNVRALAQSIERAVVLAREDVLQPSDIPLALPVPDAISALPGGELNLARSEKAVVEAALKRHGFNISHAAGELGLSRAALYRRMARHGL